MLELFALSFEIKINLRANIGRVESHNYNTVPKIDRHLEIFIINKFFPKRR